VAYACGRMWKILLRTSAGYGKHLLGRLFTKIRATQVDNDIRENRNIESGGF
jgi:hypothetical protein